MVHHSSQNRRREVLLLVIINKVVPMLWNHGHIVIVINCIVCNGRYILGKATRFSSPIKEYWYICNANVDYISLLYIGGVHRWLLGPRECKILPMTLILSIYLSLDYMHSAIQYKYLNESYTKALHTALVRARGSCCVRVLICASF